MPDGELPLPGPGEASVDAIVLRMLLGSQLRRLREAAGVTPEIQFVPGLFQTEDYARAVTRLGHQTASASEIEQRVAPRLKRQDLLSRPEPPMIWSVTDDSSERR